MSDEVKFEAKTLLPMFFDRSGLIRLTQIPVYDFRVFTTVELQWLKHLWSHFVALSFYFHGKHLRSCRDGQLT